MTHDQARADFEYLESIKELEDQQELDSERENLMRDPTKARACKMYQAGVRLWFDEHGYENHKHTGKVVIIASRHGIIDTSNS